ncbi:Imm3 family immunity protein [Paenibacillus sp. D2_2]|uniref:Imm3 family immunity protein n=1 Tax=Paenibacillus sp. D2_2 TaxID=3073092 RepID=UPI002814DE10|nr:Imm3 family immunity protein [Paenibacillus sp. D2_2]WMT42233.1 Imm3 family immunity protein [Paenibacillus sp. D2_2]
MQEWEYNELIEYVDEVFSNSINDGLDALQAGGRCMYEFANVIEEGATEKTIFYISLARLQINNGVLSVRIYEEVGNIIKTFDVDNFVDELGLDDAKDLGLRIDSLKTEMQNAKVIG